MTKQEYADYRRTEYWQALKARIIARDGYRCQKCGQPYGRLDVHHLTYERVPFGEWPEDLVTLCAKCHAKTHGKDAVTVACNPWEDFR